MIFIRAVEYAEEDRPCQSTVSGRPTRTHYRAVEQSKGERITDLWMLVLYSWPGMKHQFSAAKCDISWQRPKLQNFSKTLCLKYTLSNKTICKLLILILMKMVFATVLTS